MELLFAPWRVESKRPGGLDYILYPFSGTVRMLDRFCRTKKELA